MVKYLHMGGSVIMKPVYILTEDEMDNVRMYMQEMDKELGSSLIQENVPENIKTKIVMINQYLYSLSEIFKE